MGQYERRNKLLRILYTRRYDTIVNLARELEVSARTIRRDIEALSETEPIYTRSGSKIGGVYVVNGYYPDRLFMAENEIATLRVIQTYFQLNPGQITVDDENMLKNIIKKYVRLKFEKGGKSNENTRERFIF